MNLLFALIVASCPILIWSTPEDQTCVCTTTLYATSSTCASNPTSPSPSIKSSIAYDTCQSVTQQGSSGTNTYSWSVANGCDTGKQYPDLDCKGTPTQSNVGGSGACLVLPGGTSMKMQCVSQSQGAAYDPKQYCMCTQEDWTSNTDPNQAVCKGGDMSTTVGPVRIGSCYETSAMINGFASFSSSTKLMADCSTITAYTQSGTCSGNGNSGTMGGCTQKPKDQQSGAQGSYRTSCKKIQAGTPPPGPPPPPQDPCDQFVSDCLASQGITKIQQVGPCAYYQASVQCLARSPDQNCRAKGPQLCKGLSSLCSDLDCNAANDPCNVETCLAQNGQGGQFKDACAFMPVNKKCLDQTKNQQCIDRAESLCSHMTSICPSLDCTAIKSNAPCSRTGFRTCAINARPDWDKCESMLKAGAWSCLCGQTLFKCQKTLGAGCWDKGSQITCCELQKAYPACPLECGDCTAANAPPPPSGVIPPSAPTPSGPAGSPSPVTPPPPPSKGDCDASQVAQCMGTDWTPCENKLKSGAFDCKCTAAMYRCYYQQPTCKKSVQLTKSCQEMQAAFQTCDLKCQAIPQDQTCSAKAEKCLSTLGINGPDKIGACGYYEAYTQCLTQSGAECHAIAKKQCDKWEVLCTNLNCTIDQCNIDHCLATNGQAKVTDQCKHLEISTQCLKATLNPYCYKSGIRVCKNIGGSFCPSIDCDKLPPLNPHKCQDGATKCMKDMGITSIGTTPPCRYYQAFTQCFAQQGNECEAQGKKHCRNWSVLCPSLDCDSTKPCDIDQCLADNGQSPPSDPCKFVAVSTQCMRATLNPYCISAGNRVCQTQTMGLCGSLNCDKLPPLSPDTVCSQSKFTACANKAKPDWNTTCAPNMGKTFDCDCQSVQYKCYKEQTGCWKGKQDKECCTDRKNNPTCSKIDCGDICAGDDERCDRGKFLTCAGADFPTRCKGLADGVFDCKCAQDMFRCYKKQDNCWNVVGESQACCALNRTQPTCQLDCGTCPAVTGNTCSQDVLQKCLGSSWVTQCKPDSDAGKFNCGCQTKLFDCYQKQPTCWDKYIQTSGMCSRLRTQYPSCPLPCQGTPQINVPGQCDRVKAEQCIKDKSVDFAQCKIDVANGQASCGCFDAFYECLNLQGPDCYNKQTSVDCALRTKGCTSMQCPVSTGTVTTCDTGKFEKCFQKNRAECLTKIVAGTWDCNCYNRLYKCYAQQGPSCWLQANATSKCCALQSANPSCNLYCDYACKAKKPCEGVNCNNGFCREDGGVPYCQCSDGWVGDYCDQKSACAGYCKNKALCYIDSVDNKPRCDCTADYEGDTCDKKRSSSGPCSTLSCRNGGGCYTQSEGGQNTAFCVCANEYTGATCDTPDPCLTKPCEHGACHTDLNDYVCDCDNDWQGKQCSVKTSSLCGTNPCQNNGKCVPKYGKELCECPKNFYGDKCEKSGTQQITTKCSQNDLFNCMKSNIAKMDPHNAASKCAAYQAIANCGVTHNCVDYVKIWCNSLFKGAPDCNIGPCSSTGKACDMNIYQQCSADVQKDTSIADGCSFRKDFLNCPKDANCPDLLVYYCQKTKDDWPGCDVTADCPASVFNSVALADRPAELDHFFEPFEGTRYKLYGKDNSATVKPSLVVFITVGAIAVVAIVAAVMVLARRRMGASDLDYGLLDNI